ncbi:MAG: oligosaccharide flippase family protein [Candidatus Thiothrix sulfatifontis]|nr:MAG: oligosaccharide flippase family protein [Candidatus Thiothrix sulfatifontis]
MNLKRNIVASYASQIYITSVGILTLPLYIKYMGAEAYGLVGFFAMLQAWFALLDLGLTPTIARETAKFRAGGYDGLYYRQLFRALNLLFFGIAIIGGILLFFNAEAIGNHWLKIEKLSITEVSFALQVMAISVALRWMTGLYRGVVSGSELLVWLSGFNAFIATLRFLVIFPVLWHFGATPTVFFSFQLFVAIIEYCGLFLKSRSLLPKLGKAQQIGFSIKPIKNVLQFSLGIALTSGLWVLVTQTDKLIMSKLLTLEEYGYFTLAVLVASGIMMISAPISSSIMPRMTKLYEEGKQDELIALYRKSTQLVTVIAGSIAIILAGFSETILYLWTGNKHIVETAAPILTLYAIGYGILAVSAFPYYLQYAMGKLRLHVIGSILYVAVLLPILFWATEQYGMVGAGYAWVIANITYLFGYTQIVHNKYAPNIHLSWLVKDVFLMLTPSAIIYLLIITISG